MEIESIEISNIQANSFDTDMDGIYHQKILPCLSVVQSTHGFYDIAIDNSPTQTTAEGGAFIAPSDKLQKIRHHNGKGGRMAAQWVYLTVNINRAYKAEDIFEFPSVLPQEYNERLRGCISQILNEKNLCRRYSAAYEIMDMLISVAKSKPEPDSMKTRLRQYAEKHYGDKVNAEDLAAAVHCSVAQVFRLTHKYFGMTPANYMNHVRLQYAANMMDSTEKSITEISGECGFSDVSYFSKQFKRLYGISPAKYRKLSGTS